MNKFSKQNRLYDLMLKKSKEMYLQKGGYVTNSLFYLSTFFYWGGKFRKETTYKLSTTNTAKAIHPRPILASTSLENTYLLIFIPK